LKNKEHPAAELTKFKEQLKFIIDNMNAIARDKNVSLADRLKSQAIKLNAPSRDNRSLSHSSS